MGVSSTVYRLMNPLVQILRPIPPIAYIPLAILWFGLGNPPAFFLISLGAFFPILLNTIAGVRNVDSIYVRAAQNLGARGPVMFRRVILPAAAPHILTGVRVGYGVSFIVVIVAEMIAVNSGLGYRILEAREFFWPDKIIAGMITIGVIGLGIDTAPRTASRTISSAGIGAWSRRERAGVAADPRRGGRQDLPVAGRAGGRRPSRHPSRRHPRRVRLPSRPVGLREVDAPERDRRLLAPHCGNAPRERPRPSPSRDPTARWSSRSTPSSRG